MCICGINSRFQLLSPCAGQITHVLLTHPPLSHKNHPKNQLMTPLDLHVLGTPPAFILSQDRTLWKISIPGHRRKLTKKLVSVPFPYITVLVCSVLRNCKEFSSLDVLRCSVINVLFGAFYSRAATFIGYQMFFILSRIILTFWFPLKLFRRPLLRREKYNTTSSFLLQALFYFSFIFFTF